MSRKTDDFWLHVIALSLIAVFIAIVFFGSILYRNIAPCSWQTVKDAPPKCLTKEQS